MCKYDINLYKNSYSLDKNFYIGIYENLLTQIYYKFYNASILKIGGIDCGKRISYRT